MFLTFFYLLRASGISVSLSEWLTLMEGLRMDLHDSTLSGFYTLCRSVLLHSEADFDRFDQVFLEFFKDVKHVDEVPPEMLKWLEHPELDLVELERLSEITGLSVEEIEKMFAERLKGQDAEHNGGRKWVGTGGFTPFSFDITGQVRPGENVLTVCAEDDSRDPLIPRGKQSEPYASQGCDYTRVTGIWQTVWLEIVPETYLADYRVTTDIDNGTASFALHFNRTGSKQVAVQVLYQGKPTGDARLRCTGDRLGFTVPLKETHLWEVGKAR